MRNRATTLLNEMIKQGIQVMTIHKLTGIPIQTIRNSVNGNTKSMKPKYFSKILAFYCHINNLK